MLIGVDASRAVSGQRTGTEAYAYHLIQALIPLARQQGYRLRLYLNGAPEPAAFPNAAGVEQRVMPFQRLWTHVRLARELRQNPPDVFFTPAHVIPFSCRIPSVATVHDLGYHYFPAAHPPAQRAYLQVTTWHNVHRSRRVLADSQATKGDLVHLYHADPTKVNVVYPGIDTALKPVRDSELLASAQQKYGIHGPYLLYLGTLQPRKNLVRLLAAFAAAALSCQLVLAGKTGWLAQPIHEAVEALPAQIRERVLLPGYVSDEDKAALLSGATALVFPSLYEGFGFPLLEAQACGTPVLAANSSSLPEIAGGSALLCDPLDTKALTEGLRRLASDQPLRAQLVEKGFQNVRRFDWQEAARAVLQTLEAAAGLSTGN